MNVETLCQEVISLSKTVGAYIRQERLTFKREMTEVKSLNDFVSHVDKTAEQMLVHELEKLLPEAGFIAEEGTSDKQGEQYRWIIDPLDGTTNFIYGIPVYSISIALQRDDDIILGLVYEINQDECFYAWEGSPAYLNEQVIKVSPTATLSEAMIATGFPYYDFERLEAYVKLLQDLLSSSRSIRRLGSAAVDLAYVACGRFDGFFEYSLHAWDVAAGSFIVQQAGGKVVDFKGGDNYLFGSEIIAGTIPLMPALLGKVKKYF